MGLVCSKNIEEQVTPHYNSRRAEACFDDRSAPRPEKRDNRNPFPAFGSENPYRPRTRMQSHAVGGACCGTIVQDDVNYTPCTLQQINDHIDDVERDVRLDQDEYNDFQQYRSLPPDAHGYHLRPARRKPKLRAHYLKDEDSSSDGE